MSESSPLLRGKRTPPCPTTRIPRDHPRCCGEKTVLGLNPWSTPGSPPPPRGKEARHASERQTAGITPASAGKRVYPLGLTPTDGDHPRLRGEKQSPCQLIAYSWGSSPPPRGKDALVFAAGHVLGITPASAGKSAEKQGSRRFIWDYPRLCGEKVIEAVRAVHQHGSPPPLRGKVLSKRYKAIMPRITPASAGKRIHNALSPLFIRDHPRLCGEKHRAGADAQAALGSPPPLRGKDTFGTKVTAKAGITPASAGKRLTDPNKRGPFRNQSYTFSFSFA